MTDDTSPHDNAALPDGAVESFREAAFVLGKFPTLSQTFIYREFEAMSELGLQVNVLSTRPRQAEDTRTTRAIRAMQRDALYLEHNSPRVLASIASRSLSADTRKTLRWMMGFPHRTPAKRARAAAAVLVAAHFAPELARRGIRYVHGHFAGFQTELAMSLSHLLGIAYGCTWHAYGIYWDRNILQEKVAGARTVITCTKHNVDHLRRLCPAQASSIHLAYHGLDLDRIPEPPPIPENEPAIILAVGRIVATKGFPHLLEAASLLKKAGYHFELRLVGDGPDRRDLESMVHQLGLRDEVRFVGAQPNTEVFRHIGAARVIVVPSVVTSEGDMDGLPNVTLEAMSMGRPVVGSRVSGIPEVVIPGETGFLTEPGNAEELSEKLGLLLENATLAEELGQHGRRLIYEEFDVRQNVRSVIRHVTDAYRA